MICQKEYRSDDGSTFSTYSLHVIGLTPAEVLDNQFKLIADPLWGGITQWHIVDQTLLFCGPCWIKELNGLKDELSRPTDLPFM